MVRGGKVVTFNASDPDGRKVEKALLMNGPLQQYLNLTFAAESAVHKQLQATVAVVPGVSEMTDATKGVRAEAMQKNLRIISGEEGLRVVKDYFELLNDLTGGLWTQLRLEESDKAELADRVLIAMTVLRPAQVQDFVLRCARER